MAYTEYKVDVVKTKQSELETLLNDNIDDSWEFISTVENGGFTLVISGK
jgi:hypothetical protein